MFHTTTDWPFFNGCFSPTATPASEARDLPITLCSFNFSTRAGVKIGTGISVTGFRSDVGGAGSTVNTAQQLRTVHDGCNGHPTGHLGVSPYEPYSVRGLGYNELFVQRRVTMSHVPPLQR